MKASAQLLAVCSLIFLSVGLAISPPPASASPGWEIVLDRPTPNFGGIDFVSPDEGWLVAGGGLLHTADGGATWEEAAKLNGNDVDFADPDRGWLVGESGAIYATTDGGETWEAQESATTVHLGDVVAISPSEAWAGGTGEGYSDVITFPPPSVLLRTSDGGATWERVELPPFSWFRELATVGQQGWALGNMCAEPPSEGQYYCSGTVGALLRTSDGGASWSLSEGQPPGFARHLVFVTETHGWATADACVVVGPCVQSIYRTTDGGVTWGSTDVSALGGPSALAFQDEATGWALARWCAPEYQCSLRLLTTTNGGLTWSASQPFAPEQGYGNRLVTAHGALYLTSQGVKLPAGGQLLRSTDGGATWQQMQHPALVLRDIDFPDPRTGYAISGGALLRTDDAGRNWRPVGPAPDGAARVEFTSLTSGVLAASACPAGECRVRLYRTEDGGRTWTLVHAASPDFASYIWALQFADADHGWVALERGFLLTRDGGATWEERPLGDLGQYVQGADLADADHAWAIASTGVFDGPQYNLLRTQDGGRTWEIVPGRSGDDLRHVQFVDADHGWYTAFSTCTDICHYLVFATSDGGATWQESDLGPAYVYALAFADQLNGWLNVLRCGAESCDSEVLHSADGGKTWKTQLSGELLLGSFEFLDAETGWFLLDPNRGIGIGGGPPQRTILYHTTDGGGGPIGELPSPTPTISLPDVGQAPAPSGAAPWLPAGLVLAASGLALAAAGALAARQARR